MTTLCTAKGGLGATRACAGRPGNGDFGAVKESVSYHYSWPFRPRPGRPLLSCRPPLRPRAFPPDSSLRAAVRLKKWVRRYFYQTLWREEKYRTLTISPQKKHHPILEMKIVLSWHPLLTAPTAYSTDTISKYTFYTNFTWSCFYDIHTFMYFYSSSFP